jgi:hypothetical protein
MCVLLVVSGGTERAGEQRGSPAPARPPTPASTSTWIASVVIGVPKSDTVLAVQKSRKPA